MSVRLCGRLVCRDQAEADLVLRHLPEHLRLTRAEAGCESFDVVRQGTSLVWDVVESFRDEAALGAHRERMIGSAWATATARIERRGYVIERD